MSVTTHRVSPACTDFHAGRLVAFLTFDILHLAVSTGGHQQMSRTQHEGSAPLSVLMAWALMIGLRV